MMNDELKACSQATIALRSQCDEYYAQIKRLETERNLLSAKFDNALKLIKELETERDVLQTEYDSASAERTLWRTRATETKAALESAQARISELEAECTSRAELANWRHERIKGLEVERAAQDEELRRVYAERAALSAPAVRMEYAFISYNTMDSFDEITKICITDDGGAWELHSWQLWKNGPITIMWQRPVANAPEQASEESEAGE